MKHQIGDVLKFWNQPSGEHYWEIVSKVVDAYKRPYYRVKAINASVHGTLYDDDAYNGVNWQGAERVPEFRFRPGDVIYLPHHREHNYWRVIRFEGDRYLIKRPSKESLVNLMIDDRKNSLGFRSAALHRRGTEPAKTEFQQGDRICLPNHPTELNWIVTVVHTNSVYTIKSERGSIITWLAANDVENPEHFRGAYLSCSQFRGAYLSCPEPETKEDDMGDKMGITSNCLGSSEPEEPPTEGEINDNLGVSVDISGVFFFDDPEAARKFAQDAAEHLNPQLQDNPKRPQRRWSRFTIRLNRT